MKTYMITRVTSARVEGEDADIALIRFFELEKHNLTEENISIEEEN